MQTLRAEQCGEVGGCGRLGAAVGTVVGGLATGIAVMAAMAATGGTAAAGIGVVGAGMRVGAFIGSGLEDVFF